MAFKSFPRMRMDKIPQLFALFLAGLALTTAAARAEPVSIVGLGDSLMAGYGLAPGESVPEKLEAALDRDGRAVTVVNAGVSGDTSSGGRERLEWSVPADADLVIVELGANDMLRGIPPERTQANLKAIIETLKERGQKVLLAGMRAAPNLGADYARRFDAIYPRLAEEYGVPLVPFFLEGVAAQPALLQPDGMHPNAEGVERMVENLLPHVRAALGGNGGGRGT